MLFVSVAAGSIASAQLNFSRQSRHPQGSSLHDVTIPDCNRKTLIRYGLLEKVHVRLEVFNVLGEMVAEFVNEEKEARWHEVLLRCAQLSSGLYFYRLGAGSNIMAKKLPSLR